MGKTVAALDTETVPDVELARLVNDELRDKTDEEVIEWIGEFKGRDGFPKPMYHRIVSFSISFWELNHGFKTIRLGKMTDKGRDEKSILDQFGTFLNSKGGSPYCRIVSFNGTSFDIPVIAQRAMRHGTNLALLWDQGQHNRDAKWNNYVNRYQDAHTDLMDTLAFFNGGNRFSLNDLCVHCGLPGKIGVGGASVLETFNAGKYDEIDDYCDIDTILTFLCYVQFARTQGMPEKYCEEMEDNVRDFLRNNDNNPLFAELLSEWNGSP